MTPAAPAASIDPDAADVARAAAGDARAFAALVDRHLAMVHRLAWRSLGNDADAQDVAQDTFLRAFRQLPQWRSGQARFSTWLYRVAFNLCQDRLRGRRDHVPVEDMELPDPGEAPERALESAQRQLRVEDALAALPDRQREALLLCHYEGQSNAQAAAVLEVSVDALESLLARARRNLRAMLHDA
ncbi:RNA polymerase sigma factor [Xanthomonadaceae bacterium JHOS43]|nr:RNA polymerase sigma factor [Xanthomonadaceae bacterium JHOS43]MCX7562360.1 RNA polymerase sigma factor [Xanthomonadaceae bacterium XH05]